MADNGLFLKDNQIWFHHISESVAHISIWYSMGWDCVSLLYPIRYAHNRQSSDLHKFIIPKWCGFGLKALILMGSILIDGLY